MTATFRFTTSPAMYARCIEEYGLDRGESAGLALAVQHSWLFATVDAAAFKSAVELLGQERVVHLEDILEAAVVTGLMRGSECEDVLRILEDRNNYRRRG